MPVSLKRRARTDIWIVSDPRPEHVSAISWLNESSSTDFHFVKVEAIRIGDSQPAPLLTQIVGTSDETRQAGDTKRGLNKRPHTRRKFWSGLFYRAKESTDLHANMSPGTEGWVGTDASGLAFNYAIKQHSGRVELYIDRGKHSRDENKAIFDALHEKKNEIEASFDGELNWQPVDDARACRISAPVEQGGYRNDDWEAVQNAMIDAMIKFADVMQPYIDQLSILRLNGQEVLLRRLQSAQYTVFNFSSLFRDSG